MHTNDESETTTFGIIFGKNPVLEVIKNNSVQINKIWISESLKDQETKGLIISHAKLNKIPFHIVPSNKLNSLTRNQNHQGLVLSTSPTKYYTVKEIISDISTTTNKVILVANEIEDTHNLGAIVRTFIALDGKGIILTGRKSTGVNSTTIKTSAGSIFHAKFARASNCINVINELKKNNFWIVGTDITPSSESLFKIDLPDQIAFVIGNEHEGLGPLIKKNCDFLINIPISEKVDSLNVSVAFGILLYEYIRQRQLKTSLNPEMIKH